MTLLLYIQKKNYYILKLLYYDKLLRRLINNERLLSNGVNLLVFFKLSTVRFELTSLPQCFT